MIVNVDMLVIGGAAGLAAVRTAFVDAFAVAVHTAFIVVDRGNSVFGLMVSRYTAGTAKRSFS